MLYFFVTKSAIKERHHSKYHHQLVFHITVPSNILTDMTRTPLGTLGIKFRDRKMFIRRNRLNRLMSLFSLFRRINIYKFYKTNNFICFWYLSAKIPYRMMNRDIYIFTTYLLYRYCPDRFLATGLKSRLNWLAKSALFIRFKPSFQYPSYRNEPITVCGFIQ